jgi:hypothetical protein
MPQELGLLEEEEAELHSSRPGQAPTEYAKA